MGDKMVDKYKNETQISNKKQNENVNNDKDSTVKPIVNNDENNEDESKDENDDKYYIEAVKKYNEIIPNTENGMGSNVWLLCKILIDSKPKEDDENKDNEPK